MLFSEVIRVCDKRKPIEIVNDLSLEVLDRWEGYFDRHASKDEYNNYEVFRISAHGNGIRIYIG